MINFLKRYLVRGVISLSTHGWSIIGLLIIFLYVFGYIFMLMFNEADVLAHYTWWFMVTITTVGYGDFSPVTIGGQWTAIVIMVFGIGSIALLIGKIAEWIILMSEKQINGSLQLKVSDHILIMGYRDDRTTKLVNEILADIDDDEKMLVLCSSQLERNPFSLERVKFVHGNLASEDVLKRACGAKAEKIIIMGDNDDQTFFTAYAIRQINTHAHLVAFMQHEEHVAKLAQLPADTPELNQTILPSATNLIVQEIQDPQASHVIQHLMSNLEGANLYRLDIPNDCPNVYTFEQLFIGFRQQYQATALAIIDQELITNPPMDKKIEKGMAIFYIAEHRLKHIDWSTF